MHFNKAHFIHELNKANNIYLNERLEKVDWSAVSDGNVRINGVGNKLYLVNFESNLHPPEKKKFISYMKEKHGSIITNITTHLGDLVIELSIYVNKPMAETVAQYLNDIFTQRAETNMEKSDRKDTEKEKDGQ